MQLMGNDEATSAALQTADTLEPAACCATIQPCLLGPVIGTASALSWFGERLVHDPAAGLEKHSSLLIVHCKIFRYRALTSLRAATVAVLPDFPDGVSFSGMLGNSS